MNLSTFDPNAPGVSNGSYFGLSFSAEESSLVLVSLPWEVTTSYRSGTVFGPGAICDASLQVDLFDPVHGEAWRRGIFTVPVFDRIELLSHKLRESARQVIEHWESGGDPGCVSVLSEIEQVNEGSKELNEYVYTLSRQWLDQGKKVGSVGGDHSTPLGLIRAVSERWPGVGILHIDAHADLRIAYEGFRYSHASVMYNVLHDLTGVSALVQVGVRDFCAQEQQLMTEDRRIHSFTDYQLKEEFFRGTSWSVLVDRIIGRLPSKVYISFDIDGLDASLCPNTGTPVPGGMSFMEVRFLIDQLLSTGREVVGFDLCEVASEPDGRNDWDANVGARVLYHLCSCALREVPE